MVPVVKGRRLGQAGMGKNTVSSGFEGPWTRSLEPTAMAWIGALPKVPAS